ncbi:MAG: helix-turn-helix domain-containing protein [Novibacillus thermophilus]|jgi:transcriptional regulator with XRE-family HTH domain|uniref:HTH cro/C1-type domain-containing protein n=1 Tax=Novibacillus thermophilus TaxID=1471761 RepID=A0A1U9KAW3_9BACL|nr:helix-turn-helix transcriptional regulator [Novibacillus thermophilus]AQS57207.1 hypothetical protein B0W44_17105 [Novibacillus thermophilus]
MTEKPTLGNSLRRLRKRHRISQSELAKHIRVSRSTIAMWETSQRVPDLMMVERLADFFQVSIDELLSRHEKKTVYDPQTEWFVQDFRNAPEQQKQELIRIWQIIRERS